MRRSILRGFWVRCHQSEDVRRRDSVWGLIVLLCLIAGGLLIHGLTQRRASAEICPFPRKIVEQAICIRADYGTPHTDRLHCKLDRKTGKSCEPDPFSRTACAGSYWTARINGRCLKTQEKSSSTARRRCEENFATRKLACYRYEAHCVFPVIPLVAQDCRCRPKYTDPPEVREEDVCECRELNDPPPIPKPPIPKPPIPKPPMDENS